MLFCLFCLFFSLWQWRQNVIEEGAMLKLQCSDLHVCWVCRIGLWDLWVIRLRPDEIGVVSIGINLAEWSYAADLLLGILVALYLWPCIQHHNQDAFREKKTLSCSNVWNASCKRRYVHHKHKQRPKNDSSNLPEIWRSHMCTLRHVLLAFVGKKSKPVVSFCLILHRPCVKQVVKPRLL